MSGRHLRRCGIAAALLGGLVLAGCTSPEPRPTTSPTPAPTAPTTSSPTVTPGPTTARPTATPRAVPALDHVVIIVEENKPETRVIGNPEAPYLNSLAQQYASAADYEAITHPSLPNYLALTGGTTAGITSDCHPGGDCQAQGPSIADAVQRSGRTWRMYAEDMPAPCATRDSGDYAVKHNPFVYYPAITRDERACASHVVPLTELGGDLATADSLPDYAFISPNLCHDMHDCSIATGDAWLARQVPAILGSPAFTTQRSLLVITWDEGDESNNTVPLVVAGPAARTGGYRSTVPYSHYSLLRTVEVAWGLPALEADDRDAPAMADLLR